jgi:hypothetical protein
LEDQPLCVPLVTFYASLYVRDVGAYLKDKKGQWKQGSLWHLHQSGYRTKVMGWCEQKLAFQA